MNKHVRKLACAASVACVTAWSMLPALGQTPIISTDGVRQSENQQQQIKGQTDRAAAELGTIIGEFDRNGLGDGADVQVLKAIQGVLGNLSQKDMEKVIELLQSARKSGDAAQASKDVVAAFSGQKGIILQLQQLLLEYQRQQELVDLSMRFAQLGDRQNANYKSTRTLARAVGIGSTHPYTDVQKAMVQVQLSEQGAIRDESTALLDKLEKLVKEVDTSTAERLQSVVSLAKDSSIRGQLDGAADDLKDSRLSSAMTKERMARDSLRDLSALVAPEKDPLTVLRNAADTLAQNIREQSYVIDQAKLLESSGDAALESATLLEDHQGDIVDVTVQVEKEIRNFAPDAAAELGRPLSDAAADAPTAWNRMQEARAEILALHRAQALSKTADSLRILISARTKVLDQIARLEKAQQAEDKIAQAKDLRQQIEELRKQEEDLKKQTGDQAKDTKALSALSTHQGDLRKVSLELQQTAAAESPAATEPLGQASKDMDSAAISLGTKYSSTDAQHDEQSAIDDLVNAEKALDQQIAQLEQAKEDLAKLEKARDDVAKMIVDQQKAELNTSTLAALQDKPAQPDKQTPAPQDVSKQEDQVGQKADEVAKQVGDLAKDAADKLDDASKNAQQAKANLDKPDAKAAAPDAKDALADLQQAKTALDSKIADTQKEFGQQPDPSAKLDEVAQALDKAQQEIAQAVGEAPKDAVAQMQDQQQQVASELADMAKAGQPVQQAQQDAQQAANQLAKNDLPAAAQSMQKAEDAMQAAMKGDPAQAEQGQKPEAGQPEQEQDQHQGQPEQGQGEHQGQPEQGQGEHQGQPEQGQGQHQGQGQPALADAAKQQAALQQQLAQVAAAQQPANPAGQLDQTATEVASAAANDQGALPTPATDAMAQATAELSNAAAAEAAQNTPAAATAAAQAQAELAQAQAAVAMAQQGMHEAGHEPGHEPGNEPGQEPGEEPGMANENAPHPGKGERKDSQTNAGSQAGGQKNLAGSSSFLGLPPRDRDAIQQSRSEKYPEEYGTMIEQYLKNLSDQSSR